SGRSRSVQRDSFSKEIHGLRADRSSNIFHHLRLSDFPNLDPVQGHAELFLQFLRETRLENLASLLRGSNAVSCDLEIWSAATECYKRNTRMGLSHILTKSNLWASGCACRAWSYMDIGCRRAVLSRMAAHRLLFLKKDASLALLHSDCRHP